MKKELEALKYLKENKRRHWLEGDKSNECLDVIEVALRRKEELERMHTNALEKIAKDRKKLKALEIIKKKNLLWDIDYQPFKEDGDYRAWDNELYQSIKLTKEEYELLQEILR